MKNLFAISAFVFAAFVPSFSRAADAPAAPVSVAVAASSAHCGATQEMSALQARIVDKAAQGVGALRDFISITRGIYALDMADTVAWLDAERAARTGCVAVASNVTR